MNAYFFQAIEQKERVYHFPLLSSGFKKYKTFVNLFGAYIKHTVNIRHFFLL